VLAREFPTPFHGDYQPMTLPDERYRAVLWAGRFLRELATDRKKYPRIPLTVRREAISVLRHFPSEWDMNRAAQSAPEVFQERMEAVTRLLAQYQQSREDK
jgi:hypothetical protein